MADWERALLNHLSDAEGLEEVRMDRDGDGGPIAFVEGEDDPIRVTKAKKRRRKQQGAFVMLILMKFL